MRFAPALVALLVALLGAGPAAAQDQDAALEILRKTAATYKNAASYKLDGADTLEQIVRGNKRIIERRFRAYRLQPGGMRVEFADGGIRLTDGHLEWNYNAADKRYTSKPVPWDSRGRRALNEFFYNYEGIADFVKNAGFVAPPGKDGFLIEVTYELPGGVAAEVTKNYWIDAGTYTVRREVSHPATIVEPPTTGPISLTRTIVFQNVTWNAAMEKSLFTAPPQEAAPPAGPAPDFTLLDLNGAEVALEDLHGRPILLYFWATWCGTCREEMPKIEQLGRDYQDRGLVVLGINDEEPDIASAYLHKSGHTLRSLVDRWQDVYKKYEIEEVPTVVLIARDGHIVGAHGYGDDALRRSLKKAGLE